ncbi:PIN domain nuclease [Ectothiorhodospiraceae bacterium BW-2]|nr:PIN domain nuclease [Ectothiorhodospiraceae bacterium BW-2]
MYLVDTSVWIDYINGRAGQHVERLDQLLANPLAVGITHLIYLEILQGAKDQAHYDRFERYLSGQRFYTLQNGAASYATAAKHYLHCRQRGITIRSTIDTLIAQCAIENRLILLHHDRDFVQLAKVVPGLQQQNYLNAAAIAE